MSERYLDIARSVNIDWLGAEVRRLVATYLYEMYKDATTRQIAEGEFDRTFRELQAFLEWEERSRRRE